jgi:hypothetical protein
MFAIHTGIKRGAVPLPPKPENENLIPKVYKKEAF